METLSHPESIGAELGEPCRQKPLTIVPQLPDHGTASKNTRDEAVALREWAERNAASGFIIPSEIFSARRVRWIFRREFFGTPVSIEVPSVEPPGYTRWDWWKTEKGMVAFQNELLKYIYYRLKYWAVDTSFGAGFLNQVCQFRSPDLSVRLWSTVVRLDDEC